MKKILLALLMLLFIISVDAITSKKDTLKKGKYEGDKTSVTEFNVDIEYIKGWKITGGVNLSYGIGVTIDFSPEKNATVEDSTLDTSIDYEYENETISETVSEVINEQLVETANNTFYYSNNLAQLDSMIFKYLDTVANQIINDYKVINDFESGLRTTSTGYEYDTVRNSWKNSSRTFYQYDQSNNLIQEDFYYWPEIDTNWTFLTKTENTYTANLMSQSETFTWNEGTSTWLGIYKTIFGYDAQENMTTSIDSTWDYINSEYDPLYLEKMIYTNMRLDTVIGFDWDFTYDAWSADWAQINNYNAEDRLLSEDEYLEVPQASSTKSGSSEEKTLEKKYVRIYKYKQAVATKNILSNDLITIFPNPTAKKVNIQIENPNQCRLKVFNLQGKLVLNQKIYNSITTISTQNFDRGVYIFQINNNGKSTSRTIIKQ